MTATAPTLTASRRREVGRLQAYVPEALVRWLASGGDGSYRALDGTLSFVDISGFTRLTERLSRAGKVGAEEISQVLDAVFIPMLDTAYSYGADLLKWPGDAVILWFDGKDHAARACAAVAGMRATLRRIGRVSGTSASGTLKLSAGVHTGRVLLFLAGGCHRELVLAGPAASITAQLEAAAAPGEIAISATTAALVDPALVAGPVGPGRLLRAPPHLEPGAAPSGRDGTGPHVDGYLPVPVMQRLRVGDPDGEHRRAAVAFIRFTGADDLLETGGPAHLAAALDQLMGTAQQAAADNGVTFLETDICPGGGNIMLVAGAPRSPGRDEQRLLATVRAVLDQGSELTLQAGANAGRVFTGGLGPAYRRTYSVKGDAVNLAARLTARAAPGELLATSDVLGRSAQEYHVTPVPPFLVKGKKAPVHAFHVAERVRPTGLPAADGPIVGRDAEVAALGAALADLRGGRGTVVEVTGEPGIGKSRLLAEMLRDAADLRPLVVRCSPDGQSVQYTVAGALLRTLLGLSDETQPHRVVAGLRSAVRERAPHLLPWLPLLATAAGAQLPDTPEVAALEPAFRRSRLESAAADLVHALLPGPAVVAVEDTQFADDASSGVLARLVADADAAPWLIALTAEVPAPDLPAGSPPLRLALGPLSDDAARALLAAATDRAPLAPYRLAEIGRRAAGNPLFLRELAETALHGGDFAELPESVEGVVVAKIDRLAPADRAMLRAAAVIGTTFEPDLLADLVGRPLEPDALTRLTSFVAPQPSGTWRFRHALVQNAAYEGLPFVRRRQLHGRLAETLEQRAGGDAMAAAVLSLHFFHARSYRVAAHYARMAGEHAAAAYANPEAAGFFTRALDAVRATADPAPEELARLSEALGDIRYRLGEFASAATAFARARAAIRSDPVWLARLDEKSALAVARTSGFPAALRWTALGRRALRGEHGPDAQRQDALLLTARAMLRYQQGRYAESARVSREAITITERGGARNELARALFLHDAAQVARGQRGGEVWAERALAIWRELGNLPWQARALNALGMRAYFEADWDRALDFYRQASDAFGRTGDEWNAALASGNGSEILANQGRYAEAERTARAAERVLRASGALSETAFVTVVLGRIATRSGQPLTGIRLLEEARDGYLKAGERNEVPATEIGIAEGLVRSGSPADALTRLAEVAPAVLARPGHPHASALHHTRGAALAALGRQPAARDEFAAGLESARRRGDVYDEALAADALIRLDDLAERTPDPALAQRRDELLARLGVVTTPAVLPG